MDAASERERLHVFSPHIQAVWILVDFRIAIACVQNQEQVVSLANDLVPQRHSFDRRPPRDGDRRVVAEKLFDRRDDLKKKAQMREVDQAMKQAKR